VELQSRVKELRDRGLGLAVISYDSREIHEAFSRQNGMTFPLLSDKGSETIKRYGILNTVVEEALGPNRDDPAVKADVSKYISGSGTVPPMMKGIAFPGTFILDRQGRVTSRFFEDFYVERSTVASMLKRLDRRDQPVAGTRVSTEHLEVSTYPSDAAVAPGNRFSLAVGIHPKRGMHLYAPGASGYRVISLSIAEQPFVRILPLKYPASEIYFFKPLNERVPVYQKPFTLVQEIVLEGQPPAQAAFKGRNSLTLSGTLEYQACDDNVCFNPASIPLSWTVSLRPLVLQRPTVAR
jgi:peroxiredoxin